ncbi:MAG: protein kinase domain-containing protein, partial [Spirochaetota bacterium]
MARLPDKIGKYSVESRIGKGGMGMVYKAKHPSLDRYVILKKLNISGDAVMRERFRREAEIMIDFRTDYVVDVYDHFRHGSSDYIVLEYINGVALDELLANERYLESDLALLIARDCFRGLSYVHSKGVVHRDVKPGNVIISRDGSVKLLDFGIASRVAESGDDLTREGMTLGTVAYIAPEQIQRSRDVDKRADIYSAGAMLYEMITGRKAFSGGFNPETVNRIQRGKYRHPRRVNPLTSPLATRVTRRCMRRNPRRRYQSADAILKQLDGYFKRRGEDDLRARLAQLAGGTVHAEAETTKPRGHRLVRLVAGVAAVLAVAGIAGWLTGALQRVVLADTHALAQIEVRLRKGERELGEHLIRTEVERLVDGELTTVNAPLPFIHPVASLETPDYLVLRSRLLTLPAGRYRATVRVEGLVVRDWVSIEPLAWNGETQLFAAQWDPAALASVDLDVEARDAMTDAVVEDARLQIQRGGGWYDLVRARDGSLRRARTLGTSSGAASRGRSGGFVITDPLSIVPGETVRVRADHPDYLPAETALET